MGRAATAITCAIALLARDAHAQRVSELAIAAERWCTAGTAGAHDFLSITGAIELATGAIWASDPRAGIIAEVDRDGRSVKPIVRSGDGPGEVRSPYKYVSWPDGVFGVYDVQPSSIELFAGNGTFLRRLNLGERLSNVKGILALPQRGVLISGGIAGNTSSIHVFDSAGVLTRSFHPVPVTKNPRAGQMVGGGAISAAADGTVWFSQAAPHRISRLNVTHGTEEAFTADPTLIPTIGDDFIAEEQVNGQLVRSFKWFFPQSRAVYQFGERLLNTVWLYDENASIWEVYDVRTKRRLSSTRLPAAYHVLSRTRNGDLLAAKEDKETGQQFLCRLRTTLLN